MSFNVNILKLVNSLVPSVGVDSSGVAAILQLFILLALGDRSRPDEVPATTSVPSAVTAFSAGGPVHGGMCVTPELRISLM